MFIENIKNEQFKILIVDDNQGILDLATLHLGSPKNRMEVFTAQGAYEALALLEENKFDVIVSDFSMPIMNGLEFFKKIRAEKNKTPFILLTGMSGADNQNIIIEAINVGVDGYIQKGGNISNRFEELIEQIKKSF